MIKKDRQSKDRKRAAIRHTINAVLDGATYSVLANNLEEDVYNLNYNYSPMGARKIIREARAIVKEDFKKELPELRERLLSMLLDVYTESKGSGQYQSSLKALEQICKLTGINEPDKQEVTFKDITIDFGFNEN